VNAKERFDLTGRITLVTGGSRGIGRGIAVGLAQHGADVAIVYRSARTEAETVAEEIRKLGRRAWVYQQDLAETDRLAPLADRIWNDCGRIDVLVNNAGMAYLERFDDIPPEHWRRVMAVNLDAVFFLSQQIARRMIDAGVTVSINSDDPAIFGIDLCDEYRLLAAHHGFDEAEFDRCNDLAAAHSFVPIEARRRAWPRPIP